MDVDVYSEDIKTKIIEEFEIFLKSLNVGNPKSYNKIMDMITYIEAYPKLENPIHYYEYLMNN